MLWIWGKPGLQLARFSLWCFSCEITGPAWQRFMEGFWRTLLSMLMVATDLPMVRLISLVPMKAAAWVLAHFGMQYGNLIHHRFFGNYGAQTSCRHYEHVKHWKIPLNNVDIGRKTGRWHSTWKTRRVLLFQKYYWRKNMAWDVISDR